MAKLLYIQNETFLNANLKKINTNDILPFIFWITLAFNNFRIFWGIKATH